MIELTPPNGCRHYGIARDRHPSLWTSEVGWHTWVEPTNRMRKERMIARRAVRVGELWQRWGRSAR